MQAAKTVAPSPTITSSVDIADWRPEDPTFWKDQGARIANRNLWISIPSLLCGFAVWLMWGIITVQMANAGFPFTPDQLFSLAAIAGLSGATTRIPASFFIRICGGRNTVWLTTALLMIPAAGTGIALQPKGVKIGLADPDGSAIHNYYATGALKAEGERRGRRYRRVGEGESGGDSGG